MDSWIDLINGGYVIFKPNDWQLKKNSPKEAVKLFNKLVKRDKEAEKKGLIID